MVMRRKIFKLGRSTLVVSLPSKWVKKYNLSKEDELGVKEQERSITFSTQKDYSESEVEINVNGLNKKLIKLYIIGAYVKGYDRIKILFETPEEMSYSQETIDSLIGSAVIEQGENYCIAGEVSGTTDKQFDNIFRRIFLLIMAITEDSLVALEKGDKELLKGIQIRDKDVDKFTTFCLRVLNKKGYKEFDKTAIMYDFIQEMEELCDNYEAIAKDIIMFDSFNIRKEISFVYKETSKLIRLFYELFYDFKKEKILEFYEKRENILKNIQNLKNIKAFERTILYHLRKVNDDLMQLFQLKIASHF